MTWSARWDRTASGKRLWTCCSLGLGLASALRASVAVHALLYATGGLEDGSVSLPSGPSRPPAQASLTAATSFCSVSLASPKSMVVLGS